MTVKTGFVAFIDILGYRSLANNNDILEMSRIIKDLINKAPTEVKDVFQSSGSKIKEHNESLGDLFSSLPSAIEVLNISDSFVIFMEHGARDLDLKSLVQFNFFAMYINALILKMFLNGLPTRGAIDFGDYFSEEKCFAGEPIIRCYELASILEFSGVVFSQNLVDKFKETFENDEDRSEIQVFRLLEEIGVSSFAVPLKNDDKRRYPVMSCLAESKSGDYEQTTINSFSMHNKSITQCVTRKISNTCLVKRMDLARKREREFKPQDSLINTKVRRDEKKNNG